ncbi:hypothetical protein Tco_1432759, partial [Tanacetum coccineum]
RSKLILEETRKAKEATSDAQAACTTLLTTTNFDETKSTNHGSSNGSHGHENSRHGRGNAGHGNNGRGRGNHGRGRVSPTHVKNAMHTMTLNTPEENQYIDTGATSHMASNQGIFSSYFNIPHRKDVIVGSGHSLPFCGYEHASLSSSNPPLRLQTVLHYQLTLLSKTLQEQQHQLAAAPKSKVNDALPKTYSYFKAHSPVRRAFNQKLAAKTYNLNERVKTVRVNNVTTAGPKAAVSAAVGYGENVVKSLACWI